MECGHGPGNEEEMNEVLRVSEYISVPKKEESMGKKLKRITP